MTILFVVFLVAVSAVSALALFLSRLRALSAPAQSPVSASLTGRYKPMLRILSESDLDFVTENAKLKKKMRIERRKLFRGYLACLTRDYGRLLHGIRCAMVQSGTDRPDLAKALARNRALFALALCKIEYRLTLYTLGVGTVDISVLVTAFDTLREQVAVFSPTPAVAAR